MGDTPLDSVTRNKILESQKNEMTAISLGIAAFTFVIGFLIRANFGVEL